MSVSSLSAIVLFFTTMFSFTKTSFVITCWLVLLIITCLKVHSQVWGNFGNWNPFKNDKKGFLFHLKSSFRSQDIKFSSWLVAKRLDKKDQVNFKFYDVTAWLTNNRKHVFPNISRSKGNQIMKFGQLIECNKLVIHKIAEKY